MLAVESLLNVPVDYYVRVSMPAVVDVVDALGGVEFDVPFDMESPTSIDRGSIEIEEGEQTLNGEEALGVIRNRDVDTDLGRGNRQLEMVEAIMQKAKSTGALTKIDDLIEVVADNVRHDMSSETIRDLASYYAFNPIEFDNTQIVGDDYWYERNGGYFYLADPEHLLAISNTLRDILDMEETEPYDLINLRLHGIYEPYQYLDDYLLEDFEPEQPHPALSDDYENPYGDGFDIPDFDHEDIGVEGEDDLDDASGTDESGAEDGAGNGAGTEDEFYDNSGNGDGAEEPAGDPYYEEPQQQVPEQQVPQNDPGANNDQGAYEQPAGDPYYEEPAADPYYQEPAGNY